MAMTKAVPLCTLVVFVLSVALARGDATDEYTRIGGRGFGDDFEWRSYQDGVKEAEQSGKPIMLVFHRSTCGACKRLGPIFAKSKKILEKSKQFVLVNVLTDGGTEEPLGTNYAPDGGYIPRILFEKDGEVLGHLSKSGADKYKYFFSTESEILEVMERAVEPVASTDPSEHPEDNSAEEYGDEDYEEADKSYDYEDYDYDYDDDEHDDL